MSRKKKLILKVVHTTFFDDIINFKNFDPNRIKVDKKSYKNIIIYHIGCITIKNLSYAKINSVNPL